jgi:hypothetical protein
MYGNYLTSVQGSGNMTINNTPQFFAEQANNFNNFVAGYIVFLYILLGVMVGLGLWQMIISTCRHFSHKSTNNQNDEQDIVISHKELKSEIEKINTYKKAKGDLDDFFNKLNDNSPKPP